jgi:hypothetical protein
VSFASGYDLPVPSTFFSIRLLLFRRVGIRLLNALARTAEGVVEEEAQGIFHEEARSISEHEVPANNFSVIMRNALSSGWGLEGKKAAA